MQQESTKQFWQTSFLMAPRTDPRQSRIADFAPACATHCPP